ncbi:MAG TPA: GNAT family N-acetyltransferase [Steroidobacteraceae bacterium]|nr:GNAT family N-acetyltransferase [Steroidobacteraceae bacterium]
MRERVAVAIRRARRADADAIVTVLRRSIIELCVDDHHNDPGVLGGWLQNKTASNVCVWIDVPGNFMLIAEGGARGVCGVASLSATGLILLCYVLPEVQFGGVGRALLEAVEAEARLRGLRELSLESTLSARAFYSRHSYRPKEGAPSDSPLLFKVLTS